MTNDKERMFISMSLYELSADESASERTAACSNQSDGLLLSRGKWHNHPWSVFQGPLTKYVTKLGVGDKSRPESVLLLAPQRP
jgi:hypothetical protein